MFGVVVDRGYRRGRRDLDNTVLSGKWRETNVTRSNSVRPAAPSTEIPGTTRGIPDGRRRSDGCTRYCLLDCVVFEIGSRSIVFNNYIID